MIWVSILAVWVSSVGVGVVVESWTVLIIWVEVGWAGESLVIVKSLVVKPLVIEALIIIKSLVVEALIVVKPLIIESLVVDGPTVGLIVHVLVVVLIPLVHGDFPFDKESNTANTDNESED